MSVYGEERHGARASNEVIKLALDKYRDQFVREENVMRQLLKKEVCGQGSVKYVIWAGCMGLTKALYFRAKNWEHAVAKIKDRMAKLHN